MRVLLDENVPHDLIAALSEHDVLTVQGQGWAGTLNGELLTRASGLIDVFITLDRKLEREHSISQLPFGVIVLAARSSKVADLLPLVPAILDAIRNTGAGQIVRLGI